MSIDLYQGLTSAPEPGMPLLFAFHGTGGDERQFFGLAQQMMPGAGVVSPRGDVSERGAARFFRRTGEGVYDMEDLARATTRMVAFVAAHKDVHGDVPVFGFGYSNGANILASVVLDRPDLFDRIGLMHPLIPWTPAPVSDLADKRVMISAGSRDPICPLDMSEALIQWFEAQGAKVVPHVHEGGHELRQSEIEALKDLIAEP